MSSRQFVEKFKEILADGGDMFFSSGSFKKDEEYIRKMIMAQGYWAGTKWRYFFDEDFNLTSIEERRFGS